MNNKFGKIILTKDKLVFVKREIRYIEESSISSPLLKNYNVYINELCIGYIKPIVIDSCIGYEFYSSLFFDVHSFNKGLLCHEKNLDDLKRKIKFFIDKIFNLIEKFE